MASAKDVDCPHCGVSNTVEIPDEDYKVVKGSSGDIPSSGSFTCQGDSGWTNPDPGEGCGRSFSVNTEHSGYGD
jgi:hypothetical protein